INLAALKLANPTLTCSGTCGYSFEYADFLDLSKLGAFVTKSITREERAGNEPARIVEVRAGMLNAIGLANVGLDRFLAEKVPLIRKMPCPVIVNVAGHSFDDYTETCGAMNDLDCIAGVELNVSCPNGKDGLANVTGGLSGPAIKPIAVHLVSRVYRNVAKSAGVPIIGMGGIQYWQDAVEFILAGASAVAIGTALFVDPNTAVTICEGLRKYMEK